MSQTVVDLGRLVKSKYPEYADMDDAELGRRVKAKYPEYSDFADLPSASKNTSPSSYSPSTDQLIGANNWRELASIAESKGFTVTGKNEKSGHNPGSKHYIGQAIDIRTKDKTPAQVEEIMAHFRSLGHKVVDERIRPPGRVWTGEHIHVEYGGKAAQPAQPKIKTAVSMGANAGASVPKPQIGRISDPGYRTPTPDPVFTSAPKSAKGVVVTSGKERLSEAEWKSGGLDKKLSEISLQDLGKLAYALVDTQDSNRRKMVRDLGFPLPLELGMRDVDFRNMVATETARRVGQPIGQIPNPLVPPKLTEVATGALASIPIQVASSMAGLTHSGDLTELEKVMAGIDVAGGPLIGVGGELIGQGVKGVLAKVAANKIADKAAVEMLVKEGYQIAKARSIVHEVKSLTPDQIEQLGAFMGDVGTKQKAPQFNAVKTAMTGAKDPLIKKIIAEQDALGTDVNFDTLKSNLKDANPVKQAIKDAKSGTTKTPVIEPKVSSKPKTGQGANNTLTTEPALSSNTLTAKPTKPLEAPTAKDKPLPQQSEGVATKNASAGAIRAKHDLPGFEDVEPQKVADWDKSAKDKGYHEKDWGLKTAKDIESGVKAHLEPDEEVAMARHIRDADNRLTELESKYSETLSKGGDQSLAKQIADATDEINALTNATKLAGTTWGRSGVARQMAIKADNSFERVLARRQAASKRPLTTSEIGKARTQTDELKNVQASRMKAESDLDIGYDPEVVNRTLKSIASTKKVMNQRRINDVGKKLQEKWAASKVDLPSGAFSNPVVQLKWSAKQVARLADVAPEITEIVKLYAEKGFIELSENLPRVVSHLKSLGIHDITENDVAGILAGKIKRTREQTMTAYQAVKKQAVAEFQNAEKAIAEQERLAAQQAREAATADRKAAAAAKKEQLKAEREKLNVLKKAFWEAAKSDDKFSADNMRIALREYEGSIAGKEHKLSERIENLKAKLDDFHREGVLTNQQSRVKPRTSVELENLKTKEASLIRQIQKEDALIKAQAEFDTLPKWAKAWKQYNPWSLTKSTVASFDNSQPFNQGFFALFADPSSWFKGTKSSFASFRESKFEELATSIRASERFDQYEAGNLFEGAHELEDVFGTRGLSNLWGYKHTQRAFEGGGMRLRKEMFDSWANMAEDISGRRLTLGEVKSLAQEIKTFTGQGVLGRNNKLSPGFMALRYRLSQFEVAFGAPLIRAIKHGRATGDYAVAKVIARKYGQAYGTALVFIGGTSVALNKFSPKNKYGRQMYRLETNPMSTDFGRVVIDRGDSTQVIDVLPQQMRALGRSVKTLTAAVSAFLPEKYRIYGVNTVGSNQDFNDIFFNDWGRYIASGLHPLVSGGVNVTTAQLKDNKQSFGKSYDLSTLRGWANVPMTQLPLSAQNAIEITESKDMTTAEKIIWGALGLMLQSNTRDVKPPSTTKTTKSTKPSKQTKKTVKF